jgi:hypothetical protein
MNTAQTEFLSWKLAPARLNATQAAWFLGFEPHEITILIATGCLKPLGHPARNATKFFATETLEQLRRDEKWLAKASDAIWGYWRERNARKQTACGRSRGEHRSATRSGQRAEASAAQREPVPVGTE